MTRKEAIREVHKRFNSRNDAIIHQVTKWTMEIYDSFDVDIKLAQKIIENEAIKRCENCKYYIYCSKVNGKTGRALSYYRCEHPDIEADGGYFEPDSKDFGCNKFERKEDDNR